MAIEMAMNKLEDIVQDRAINGWLEPEWYKGKVVGDNLKFDHGLMKFLLQTHKPKVYRNNEAVDALKAASDVMREANNVKALYEKVYGEERDE